MSAINEALIRDVVAEVLGRLGQAPVANGAPSPAPPKETCACGGNGHPTAGAIGRGKHGVFQDANEACEAAQAGFLQLRQKGVAARAKVVEIVKALADANATEWGRIELEETQIGRLDHKIEKLLAVERVLGVEAMRTDAHSGSWLFPIYSHVREKKTGNTDNWFLLLGGHDQAGRHRHSWFWPLFHYNDDGPLDSVPAQRELYATYGTTFTTWSLRYWDPVSFAKPVPVSLPASISSSSRLSRLSLPGLRKGTLLHLS